MDKKRKAEEKRKRRLERKTSEEGTAQVRDSDAAGEEKTVDDVN
jgi:hypothetical protein